MTSGVLVIAHRGASAMAPESTAAAIRLALRLRADMIELDVQMTADHRLVIFHDDRLDRTTNGTGLLRRLPYAEVAQLDAGSWFAPRFAGARVLLASQALRLISPRRVNLELKRTSHPHVLISGLVRCVRRARATMRVLVSSFEPSLLARVCAVEPMIALALLCRRKPRQALQRAVRLGCVALHPHVSLVTPSLVAEARAAGLRLQTWTVDDARLARRVARLGVDGVFTNRPDYIRRALG